MFGTASLQQKFCTSFYRLISPSSPANDVITGPPRAVTCLRILCQCYPAMTRKKMLSCGCLLLRHCSQPVLLIAEGNLDYASNYEAPQALARSVNPSPLIPLTPRTLSPSPLSHPPPPCVIIGAAPSQAHPFWSMHPSLLFAKQHAGLFRLLGYWVTLKRAAYPGP